MVSLIHGDFAPTERDLILDKFRTGKTRVLIATNILARGIDIMQVSLVINYDIPQSVDGAVEPETYLHRIGRTARYGRSGIAVNLVGDQNQELQVKRIAAAISHEIAELAAEKIDQLDEMLKECKKRDEVNLRLLKVEQQQQQLPPERAAAVEADTKQLLKPSHPHHGHGHGHGHQGKAAGAPPPTTTVVDATATATATALPPTTAPTKHKVSAQQQQAPTTQQQPH